MLKDLSKKPTSPSTEEVKKYLKQWEDEEEYRDSEKSLSKLFLNSSNNSLDEIIVKVCALDVVFSAQVGRWFFDVSKHIKNYDFDTKFKDKEFDVNKFAIIEVKDIKNDKTKNRNFYSFATKYCSHHNSEDYPIYDFYVDEVLQYFMGEKLNLKKTSLKKYPIFVDTLKVFREEYHLEVFKLREIDKYIWLLGKEFFTR